MARTGARGGTIVDRLTEVLFLQLLDYYVENNESSSGFLVYVVFIGVVAALLAPLHWLLVCVVVADATLRNVMAGLQPDAGRGRATRSGGH